MTLDFLKSTLKSICKYIKRVKCIAATVHGLNQLVLAGWSQGLTQTADMRIYRAILNENIVPPDTIKNLLAAEYPTCVRGKEVQQTTLQATQIDPLALATHPTTARINLQASHLDNIIIEFRHPAAQDSVDACQ